MMATLTSANVIVWEWCDDNSDWRAYSSQVSNHMEQHHRSSANTAVSGNIALGSADPGSHMYEVDLNTMTQIRRDTGRRRIVRRSVYPPTSLYALGVLWEWMGDHGAWQQYSREATTLLEKAHVNQMSSADLAPCGIPYAVDLRAMTQVNKQSNFVRQVHRVQIQVPYVRESGASTSSSDSHGTSATTHLGQKHVNRQTTLQSNVPSGSQTLPGPSRHGNHSIHNILQQTVPINVFQNQLLQGHSLTSVQHHLSNILSISVPPKSAGGSGSSNQAVAVDLSVPSTSSGRRSTFSSHIPKPKRHKSLEQLNRSPETVIDNFTTKVEQPDKEECPICCEEMTLPSGYDSKDSKILRLEKCKHHYHRACLLSMYMFGTKDGSLQCPTCKCIHGTKMGTCPPGSVNVQKIVTTLPGYDNCSALLITYNISSSVQGPEHPNPGETFTARGFPRKAYLPNNEQGNKVCQLLLEAWRRRLTFTIGNSVTTGEQSTVVWNEIHHKTEIDNRYGHGYPDPNYLDNVMLELKAQGVTEEDL